MFSSMPRAPTDGGIGRDAKYAPIGGPMQKQIANAIPTWARALERFAGVVTSERIALFANCQLLHLDYDRALTWRVAHCLR